MKLAKKKRAASNRQRNRAPRVDIRGWYRHHVKCAIEALLGLVRQPISSALTWLVIAIALMLPTLFYIALQAMNAQTQAWQAGGQITLYLARSTSEPVSDGRDEADATTDLYCFSSDDRDMCEVAKECDCASGDGRIKGSFCAVSGRE